MTMDKKNHDELNQPENRTGDSEPVNEPGQVQPEGVEPEEAGQAPAADEREITAEEPVQEAGLHEEAQPEPAEEPVMNKVGAPAAAASGGAAPGRSWMFVSLALAVVLVVVLIKPPFQNSSSQDAVATVNGADITKDELYEKLVEAGGQPTLDSMITMKIVEQEADKAGISVSEADIDAEVAKLTEEVGGEDTLQALLLQNGMSIEDLRAQMPLQIQLRKLLEPQVEVTDADIEADFEANKAMYDTAEQVRASHILVETKEEADAVLKELNEGADFAELAKEKSTDTASGAQGGDLNFFSYGDMVPEFSEAAFALETGELSEPVQSSYGFHVIKVTERKEAHTATLEEKKEEIREKLISTQVSQLSSGWLADKKAEATISNTLTDNANEEATSAEE